MSYILEALKKAEHQREIGRVPHIDSEHEPAAVALSPRWTVIVVLILLINAGLLLVLFWPDGTTGVSGPVAMSPDIAPAPAPTPVTLPPPQAAPAPIPRPVKTHPAISPVIAPMAPPPRSEPVQATAPVKYERNLPVWPRVPTHIFQRLNGGLRLDVHVYSDQPQGRFVLINLQKYREGEQLQEGPVLDEITSEGVVLSFEGQQFLVQAQ